MVDQPKSDAQTAAEAPAKVVEAVAKAADKVVESNAKAVKATRAKSRRAATKSAKTTARRTATRRAKPAAKRAAPKIERTKTMTFDAAKLFTVDALPGADKFQKAAEELAEIAKANVEALTEAGRIAASGARSIGQDVLASGREGIEQASAAVKTLAEAKSPTEFFQIQSELARASFDRAVSQ